MDYGSKALPQALTAAKKGTFAYTTVKDRLPVTITKAIDYLSRFRNELIQRYTDAINDDLKNSIELLSQLRYELTTDKNLKKITDSGDDAILWNKALEELENMIGEKNCTWFKAPWLFVECYIYRRIRESMLLCETSLRDYDPFEKSKKESYELSFNNFCQLITSLCPLNYHEEKTNENLSKERFRIILEATLWANKNDLSLSSGNDVSSKIHNLIDLLESFKTNILCDHTENLWNFLNEIKLSKTSSNLIVIDIVLDNCSIEFVSDLILCDFLLRNNFVDKIRLHGKAYSWFISDVTRFDFDYLILQLQSSNSLVVNNFLKRLNNYLNEESSLELYFDGMFWTSPYSFDQMLKIDPDLYQFFKESSTLILFKGDLNYRKLLGDLEWDMSIPLKKAIREFRPTSLCAIRTVKSDLMANLNINSHNYIQIIEKFGDSKDWMVTGDYGLIQFVKNYE
ncbi:unnamed protein product [Brachionus calyciflorus]|uniref:Sugar phosphate phosphatase n=1 Tax=Brachionus calyciflorus TaxID=104777 RepID=A0A813YFX8_9BILA|nr:unnamed protein product [Brachionus calyciflorus]